MGGKSTAIKARKMSAADMVVKSKRIYKMVLDGYAEAVWVAALSTVSFVG